MQGAHRHNPRAARSLGREAVSLGLETMDLVRIHGQTVAAQIARHPFSGSLGEWIHRADTFFAKTLAPIETLNQTTAKMTARIRSLKRVLRQRTRAAAVTAQRHKKSIRRRQASEAALERSKLQETKRRAEMRRLQTDWRQRIGNMFAAQEEEEDKTSRIVFNGLFQTLLGIQVRLLALEKRVVANAAIGQKEIDRTEGLIKHITHTLHGQTNPFQKNPHP